MKHDDEHGMIIDDIDVVTRILLTYKRVIIILEISLQSTRANWKRRVGAFQGVPVVGVNLASRGRERKRKSDESCKIKEEGRREKEGEEIREEKKSRRGGKSENKKEKQGGVGSGRRKEKEGKEERREIISGGSSSLRNNTPQYILVRTVVYSCSVSCNLKRVHAN